MEIYDYTVEITPIAKNATGAKNTPIPDTISNTIGSIEEDWNATCKIEPKVQINMKNSNHSKAYFSWLLPLDLTIIINMNIINTSDISINISEIKLSIYFFLSQLL